MNRRNFLISAAGATAAAAAGLRGGARENPSCLRAGKPAKQGAPNILIFMPDQQFGGTVLPNHPCITPNIERFAAQAVTFNSAYCPAPHCCPSRASFMTGLYPSEHGVYNNVMTNTAIHTDPALRLEF